MLLPSDPVDWLAFALRIKWILAAFLLFLCLLLLKQHVKVLKDNGFLYIILVVTTFLLAICIGRMVTGKEMLLTLLGSEDDQTAERSYKQLEGKVSTSWVLRRINDKSEEANVRFYLCRMLASVSTDASKKLDAIDRVNSDPLAPRFIGRNTLNHDIEQIPKPVTTRHIVEYYYSRRK